MNIHPICVPNYILYMCTLCRKETATSRASTHFVRSELLDRKRDVFSDKKVAFQFEQTTERASVNLDILADRGRGE